MPIYEYRCKECGHVTEVLEAMNARGSHRCEECKGRKLEKQFSAFGVGGGKDSGSSSSCPTGTCPFA